MQIDMGISISYEKLIKLKYWKIMPSKEHITKTIEVLKKNVPEPSIKLQKKTGLSRTTVYRFLIGKSIKEENQALLFNAALDIIQQFDTDARSIEEKYHSIIESKTP
ncbi:hypothetical protein [Aquimarina pacifica]|uniref:hypothetical protein n=1 Tax=Aquimarina pacifica TaxID=1296415 RepID=UPI00046E6EBA|nr:hypothetical protein [Aquimarina pacifica]